MMYLTSYVIYKDTFRIYTTFMQHYDDNLAYLIKKIYIGPCCY